MKILITGGNGFIGRNLIVTLAKDKANDITILDLQEFDCSEYPNVKCISCDITSDVEPYFEGIDEVYHLAGFLGVVSSDNNPLKTLEINLETTKRVLQISKKKKVKRFFYSSSSEVYGNSPEIPFNEDGLKAPVSTYGVSKLAAEEYCKAYMDDSFFVVIGRFFNVYGPFQRPHWVVPIFIKNAINGIPIIVFGDGSQVRCYSYIEDVIKGIIIAMRQGKNGEAYNIGNDTPTSLIDLAYLIEASDLQKNLVQIKGFSSETREEKREVFNRIPDITKIKELGWNVEIHVEEGIKKTIKWFKTDQGKKYLDL